MTWPEATLASLAKQFINGGTPSTKVEQYWTGDIPWITGADVTGNVVSSGRKYITREAVQNSSTHVVPRGAILLVSRTGVGKIAKAGADIAISQDLTGIVLREGLVTDYVIAAIQHRIGTLQHIQQGAIIKGVLRKDVENLKIPVPARSEQQRIVHILDQGEALRQQRQSADDKAERIQAAVFYRLFGDPATNPKGWPVEAFASRVVDFRYGTSERCEASYGGLPILRIPNVVGGNLDLASIKYADLPPDEIDRLRLQRGDVLFVRTNGNPDYVGRCCVFDKDEPYLFASYLIRARFDQRLFCPAYVVACLSTPAGRRMLAPGIRTTAGQSNVSVAGLRQIAMPRPPVELQRQFEQQLAACKGVVRNQRSVGDRINRLLHVLRHRAFTGELTAGWREIHKDQLKAEMQEQLTALEQPKAAKPKRGSKGRGVEAADPASHGRHAGTDMYNKAALVTYIAVKCHDAQRPNSLGRTKVAKLFYLVQRRAEISLTQQFTRRAAGPLDDAIHKFLSLAKKNGWLALPRVEGPLKPVVPGDNPQPAIDHVRQRWADSLAVIDEVLETMKGWGWQALERWATVENAAQQLAAEGKPATLAAIKGVIAADPVWRPKLDREAFSDSQIQSTLIGLRKHGYLPADK